MREVFAVSQMQNTTQCGAQGQLEEFFELGQKLGKGAFSTVFLGTEKGTRQQFAIKAIKKQFIKKKLLDREIEIMTSIRHDNILYCKTVYETDQKIFLVLELVQGGELYDKIVEDGEYTEDESKNILMQILDAVEYLHEKGIAHRDLKPENILCVTQTSKKSPRFEKIKVADFGLSKVFAKDPLVSQCGSPTYVAPEVLVGQQYTKAVDMWAIGVISFVMLTGCFPFYEENDNYAALYKKIMDVDYTYPDNLRLSDLAKDFISHLLVKDPTARMTPQQCFQHPWLSNQPNLFAGPVKMVT